MKLLASIKEKLGLIFKGKSNQEQCSHGFIPARQTIERAKQANLSVGDYVEKIWNSVGETDKVIDLIKRNGISNFPNPRILEIGPGTGRYLDKLIKLTNTAHYETYETAHDWREWLMNEYPIIAQEADGKTLNSTLDNDIDFIHAHGVFVYLPTVVSIGYFEEILRVAKKDALICFDIISENCLTKQHRERWIKSGQYYPVCLSKSLVIEIFKEANFKILESYIKPYGQGLSEYLLFKGSN